MYKIYTAAFFLTLTIHALAQKEIFDITEYTAPAKWKKTTTASNVQFTAENNTTGGYCMILVFKALPAAGSTKENFDLTWATVVKEMVTVNGNPEMQPPASDNGWEALTGYAPFEKDGNKGVALLVSSGGFNKMVNILILTNTNVYEKEVTAFLESVDIKKPAIQNTSTTIQAPAPAKRIPAPAAKKTGFAFTTTNFDDGWTSTVQEDWVEVTKGTMKILIHYPNAKADAYNSVLKESDYTAWNTLVAPRYQNMSNFEWKTIQSWQSVTFVQADATEIASGKKVHIILFKLHYSNGSGAYMEFVTNSLADYEKEFGPYRQESFGWEKTANMQFRNKFAVAASDLNGKWTNNFTGMTQYVNAYTGASAGADTHASAQSFIFGAGNTYKWDIGMASGFTGNIKFQSARSNGKFTLPNAWQVHFSEMEGKPKTYDAYFSCVKGGRLLWLSDVTYPGYTAFGKAN
ncbi:MAG: hypothetical protein U0V75_16035 [Ferruginibacter sp.]